MTYLSTRSTLIPYVIEVDQTGNAKVINPAYQINYNLTEANKQYILKDWIKNARWITTDRKEVKKQHLQHQVEEV